MLKDNSGCFVVERPKLDQVRIQETDELLQSPSQDMIVAWATTVSVEGVRRSQILPIF